MSDLRDPTLDDLEGMFRRREGDVAGTPRLSEGARRRVRRRQGATVGASAIAAIAVVAVAASLLPRTSPPAPLDTSSAPRTSTIQGTTVTYPGDWYMVALPQVTSDWADQQPPSAFRPVFQLSNFDPVSDAVGDDNRHWFCPIASGQFPDGGSLLYIEAIGGPIAEGADAWPVSYPQEVAAIDSGGACGGDTTVDTSWTADGVTYHGVVMGDAGDPEIQAAFDSMRFVGGTPATPGDVDEGPLTSEAHVLASGEGGSSAWNLIVHADEGCLAVAGNGARIVWECDAWDLLDGSAPFVEYRNGRVLFGPIATDVARLEYRHDDGRIDEVEISTLPPSFGDLRAYAFHEPGVLSGALVAFDASGAMIGTALPTPTPPAPTRTADQLSSVVSFAGTDEGVPWSAEFRLDHEGRFCMTTVIDGDAASRCGDEPTFTFPPSDWLPPPHVGDRIALAAGTLPSGFVSIEPGDWPDTRSFHSECLPGPGGAVPDRYACVVVLPPSGQVTLLFVGEDPTLITESPIEWGEG